MTAARVGAAIAGLIVLVAGASVSGANGSTVTKKQARAETSPAVITFHDDFNGPSGDSPYPWVPKLQTRAEGEADTGEIEYYTDSRKNSFLDGDGHLVIAAHKTDNLGCPVFDPTSNLLCYTSARLSTRGRFSQQGGRFEARLKMPIGNSPEGGGGVWPAFWLLGRNNKPWPAQGEIDIDENTGQKSFTHGFLHSAKLVKGVPPERDKSGERGSFGGQITLPNLDLSQFHTFAVDIEPTAITWYIDDTQVQRLTLDYWRQTHPDIPWLAEQPWYLILNVAIGGWAGWPTDSLQFPKEMVVDWVRASCPFGEEPNPVVPAPADTDAHTVRCKPSPGQ